MDGAVTVQEGDKKLHAHEKKKDESTKRSSKEKKEEPTAGPNILQQVFAPYIVWTPHDYDSQPNLHEQLCPTGGPGGLVCCHVCASAYSRYLAQAVTDMDTQNLEHAGNEVQELMGFMDETRSKLQGKVRLAQHQKPPPRGSRGAAQVASMPSKTNSAGSIVI